MNPNNSHNDPFADLDPFNGQIPSFARPPNNDGSNLQVETVTSSSQVSPIDQSGSINWNQGTNQSNTSQLDWTGHRGQRGAHNGSHNNRNNSVMNNVSNSRNNITNNTNYSNSNPILLPSILSVATSTTA